MANPLVSIVTPVYNGEKYLAECIESVLAQTYQNWEYIINNNCSTDRTLEIARMYAQKDRRIRIHSSHAFVSAIRNHNIAVSLISPESKYCKIVQADDLLFPECLARMVEVAEAYPSVGLVSSYRLQDRRVDCDGLPYPSTFIRGREMGRLSLLDGVDVFGSMSTFLMRSDVIRGADAFFNEDHIYADTEACFKVLQSSDFGFVHQVLSFTRRHREQLTTFASYYQTYTLARLYILREFGPSYLDPGEQELQLKQWLDNYYRTHGNNLLRFRGKRYWRFHRTELAKLGYSFSWARLLKGAFLEAARVLFAPLKAIQNRVRYLLRDRVKDRT